MKNGVFMLAACLFLTPAFGNLAGSIAVVKYAKGNLRVSGGPEGTVDLKPSDLLPPNRRIEAGQDGKAVLRLLPDQSFLEIRPRTVFQLRKATAAGKKVRKAKVEMGTLVFGQKKTALPMQCENTHTLATIKAARFSFSSDDKAVGIFIVQAGEISVYNRPKDATAVVRAGQKAVSDLNGIKVTDASDAELDQVGFRQNTVEVDFVNPQSEEFSTLEVEYETNF